MIGRCALGLLAWLLGCSSPAPASFTIVDQHETAALLSAWGSSASDVWVVGGRPDLAAGPTVLHFNGTAWQRIDIGHIVIRGRQRFLFADGGDPGLHRFPVGRLQGVEFRMLAAHVKLPIRQ